MLAGREPELTRNLGFIGDPAPELRWVVVRGDAGIGKTAVGRTAIDELRGEPRSRRLETLPASSPPRQTTSAAERLRDLAKMRDEDLITVDEFDEKRQAIIA